MATVPARNKRSRGSARSGRRFLAIAASAFVGVNLYLLVRGSVHAPSQLSDAAAAGEGSHRYRQIETAADIVLADQATTLAAGAGEQQQQQQQQQQEDPAAAGGSSGGGDQCHAEENAEYDAEKAIVWGEQNLKDSAAECCASCQAHAPRCNVWVYCGRPEGCFSGRQHKECWLKHADRLDPVKPRGKRSPDHGWTSGAIYSLQERQAALDRLQAAQQQEQQYLDRLRGDERLPMVFLDVAIKGQPVGRIEMVLFTDVSPRAAENFRQLCTGESGSVPSEPGREGGGRARHLKGAFFYRIIDQFIDQAGVETESVFGGQFKDDPGGLQLKHEHKGLLSMANMGHDTNTAHFSIMMGPAHHLDGDYTIFGQVVSGFDVVDAVNALSRGKKDNTATAEAGAQIVDSGQLRRGTLVPDLTLGLH